MTQVGRSLIEEFNAMASSTCDTSTGAPAVVGLLFLDDPGTDDTRPDVVDDPAGDLPFDWDREDEDYGEDPGYDHLSATHWSGADTWAEYEQGVG